MTTGNNAAMNTDVYISLQVSVFLFLGANTRSGIPKLHGSPIFNFLRKLHTVFLNVNVTNFQCTKVHNSYLFCISLPRIIILCLFNDSHSDRYQVISQCGFDCISDIEHLFMCPQTIYIYIMWKNVYLGPLPILKLYFLVLLILSCMSSLASLVVQTVKNLSAMWETRI